jgi:hypothetical protein
LADPSAFEPPDPGADVDPQELEKWLRIFVGSEIYGGALNLWHRAFVDWAVQRGSLTPFARLLRRGVPIPPGAGDLLADILEGRLVPKTVEGGPSAAQQAAVAMRNSEICKLYGRVAAELKADGKRKFKEDALAEVARVADLSVSTVEQILKRRDRADIPSLAELTIKRQRPSSETTGDREFIVELARALVANGPIGAWLAGRLLEDIKALKPNDG